MNVLHLIHQGGLCMLPLLAMSIVALALCLDRALYFASLEWGGDRFRDQLRAYIRHQRWAEGLLWLNPAQGPVAQVARLGLNRWGQPVRSLQSAIAMVCEDATPRLHQHLTMLETFVTASPLIGLLGTITGMMSVFRQVAVKMTQQPQADTSGILAGIGEALIATASGIMVAVACLLAHNLFQFLAERQMERTRSLSRELLNLYEESDRER